MTENKRFKADIYNFEIWDDDVFLLSFDQTVDLLNQLNEENEQLKKENKKLICIIKQLEVKYEDKGFSLAYDMRECE